MQYCGEPVEKRAEMSLQAGVYVDKRSGLRVNGHDDVSVSRGYYLPYGRTEVLRENWVYNFGPNRLMRQVTFDNGIVADVRDAGVRLQRVAAGMPRDLPAGALQFVQQKIIHP